MLGRFLPPQLRFGALVGAVALVVIGGSWLFFRSTESVEVYEAPVVPRTTRDDIGRSVEGRAIEAYTFGNGDTHVLFVGGIHGGYEWNSVALAYTMIDHFTSHPEEVPPQVTIAIVPSANPDGVFAVVGKEGPFAPEDVPNVPNETGKGRFNAHNVDLNRNFDCKWQPKSTWRSKEVSAGTAAFSEPEAQAIRDFVERFNPVATVFWHSQSNAVYASECMNGILPGTRAAMNAYAHAAGYTTVDTFDAYEVTGDAEGWLASQGIPAITVELSTHTSLDWDKNRAGVGALLALYASSSEDAPH